MSANTISVVGNLVADPELRFTTTGKPVTNARLAVNERILVNGQWTDRTNFFNVVAWNAMAENVACSATKGTRLMVSGRLQTREYQAEGGDKQYFTEIVATEIGVALRFHLVDSIEKANGASTEATSDLVDADGPF